MRFLALVTAGILAYSVSAQTVLAQAIGDFSETRRRVADARVDASIEEWLQTAGIPGAVVAVVQDSEVLALQGHGVTDVVSEVRMDPRDTVLWAGELVRMFTAAALLRLFDEERIELSTDVNLYLNRLSVEPAYLPPVSVASLLTETSGIDEILTGTMARSATEIRPLGDYLQRRLPPRVRLPDRVSVPSVHGFSLAGLVVEEVTNQSFSSYLQDHLIGPAGLRHTATRAGTELSELAATGYRLSDGAFRPRRLDYPQNGPASSLWTTAEDMGRWMRILLAGGGLGPVRLLESSSTALLLSEQFSNHNELAGRSFGLVSRSIGDLTILSRTDRSNGFSATLLLVPSQNLGLFVACNAEADVESLVREVLGLFVVLGTERRAAEHGDDIEILGRLRGWYRDSTRSHSSPEKLLTLLQQERVGMTDAGSLIWRQQKLRSIGDLAFETDSGGSAVAFLMPPGGRTYLATDDEVLERLAWFEWWPVQAFLWWLFASSFLAIAWTRVHLAPEKPELLAAGTPAPRWPFRLARIAALIYFLFMIGSAHWLVMTTNIGPQNLIYGAPSYLRGLLELPRLALLISVPVIASVPVAWIRGHGGRRLRWRLSWMALLFLAFVPFLRYWKLLGFQI